LLSKKLRPPKGSPKHTPPALSEKRSSKSGAGTDGRDSKEQSEIVKIKKSEEGEKEGKIDKELENESNNSSRSQQNRPHEHQNDATPIAQSSEDTEKQEPKVTTVSDSVSTSYHALVPPIAPSPQDKIYK
jgi:hypothetical protein